MRLGAALPMVLLSLGLVAALTVGGSFVTRRYAADARLYHAAADLEPLVEAGLVGLSGALDSTVLLAIPVGGQVTVAMPVTFGQPGLVTGVWVTRLNSVNFAMVGEVVTTRKPLLSKRLRLVVSLDSAGLRPIPLGAWSRLP